MTWAPTLMAAASTWRSLGSGELKPIDERLVSGDEAVRDGAVDQLAQAGELLLRDVRAVARQGSECLVEDVFGPFCLYQADPADADQQVPRRVAVRRVGIIDNDEGHGQGRSSSWLRAASSSRTPRRCWSSRRLYSWRSWKVIRRCLPTVR